MISKNFKTPLGLIYLNLISNFENIVLTESGSYDNGTFDRFKSVSHNIEIIESSARNTIYNGKSIFDSKCWIVRIEKFNSKEEYLEVNIGINQFPNDTKFDFATGEHLDAFEASNKEWKLHVGTEDGELLNSRAENNNWFPIRLFNKKNYYQEITKLKISSIKTNVPKLEIGEKISLQYLTAFDKQNDNVNTWLTVDDFKDDIEKWVGIK